MKAGLWSFTLKLELNRIGLKPCLGQVLCCRQGLEKQFFMICSRFFGRGEAALAADLITARKTLQGGCASSRVDHGLTIRTPDRSGRNA